MNSRTLPHIRLYGTKSEVPVSKHAYHIRYFSNGHMLKIHLKAFKSARFKCVAKARPSFDIAPVIAWFFTSLMLHV